MEHGTPYAYRKGCHCPECRAANTARQTAWRKANPDSGKIQRECAECGKPFMAWPDSHYGKRRPPNTNRFCSPECAGIATGSGARPAVYDKTHPLADRWGRVAVHRKVLLEKIGPGTHACHWCQRPVTWIKRARTDGGRESDLMADHLDGDCRNNDPANLVPACSFCNVLRGWIQKWERLTGRPIDEMRPQPV